MAAGRGGGSRARRCGARGPGGAVCTLPAGHLRYTSPSARWHAAQTGAGRVGWVQAPRTPGGVIAALLARVVPGALRGPLRRAGLGRADASSVRRDEGSEQGR